jgi:hypothetical protein
VTKKPENLKCVLYDPIVSEPLSHYLFQWASKEEEATVVNASSFTTTKHVCVSLKEEEQLFFGKIECFSSSPKPINPSAPSAKFFLE